MANLLEFTNPLSGAKGKASDIGGLWSLIFGGAILFIVFNLSQKLATLVTGKMPGGIGVGFDRPLVNEPATSKPARLYGCA